MSLDKLKLENVRHSINGAITARCPACAEEGHDSDGDHLIIFANGKFGCVVNQQPEHYKRIFRLVGDGVASELPTLSAPEIEAQESNYSPDLLKVLLLNNAFWNNRGISDETLKIFKGGLAITDGKLKHRYVFPLFNERGKINGFTGRYVYDMANTDAPKWKHVGLKSFFTWPYFLWNEKRVKKVLLVESPGCVLKLWENKFEGALCLFGINLYPKLLSLLISINPDKIIVATNNEPGNKFIGNKAAANIKNTLLNFFDEEKILIKLPTQKDFGDMSNEEIETYLKELQE